MPQLNPAPWLTILIITWLVFLLIIPPKMLAYIFNNEPNAPTADKSSKNVWNWPWY
uniref:ATP synthase complex subunit 8 n=1 Tax=Acestrorhynchus sp. NM-2010 TaxID=909829 RepID=F7UID2_9TELE|nr:ATP synthase F0 subunit 8 [Acestrorhynchus sp. NM-2010]BAK41996.1 ATPase subunit 8 [Acestrorhynchus sp. NM-2010]